MCFAHEVTNEPKAHEVTNEPKAHEPSAHESSAHESSSQVQDFVWAFAPGFNRVNYFAFPLLEIRSSFGLHKTLFARALQNFN